jgi:hypothetical protein
MNIGEEILNKEPAPFTEAELPVLKETLLDEDTLKEEVFPGESCSPPEISAVLELLNCLRQMTEELPEKGRNTFLQGRFPAALESVIDSLKSLAIIKRGTSIRSTPVGWGSKRGGDAHGSGS